MSFPHSCFGPNPTHSSKQESNVCTSSRIVPAGCNHFETARIETDRIPHTAVSPMVGWRVGGICSKTPSRCLKPRQIVANLIYTVFSYTYLPVIKFIN